MLRVCSVLSVLLLTIVGCGDKPAAAARTSFESKVYSGSGYTMLFPAKWEQQPGSGGGVEVIAIGKPTSASPDFAPNVNVVAINMPRAMSIDSWWPSTLKTMQAAAGFKEIEQGNISHEAGQAKRLLWEHTMMARPMRVATYVFAKGTRAFAIQCTDTTESFETSRPVFEEIASSFRFK